MPVLSSPMVSADAERVMCKLTVDIIKSLKACPEVPDIRPSSAEAKWCSILMLAIRTPTRRGKFTRSPPRSTIRSRFGLLSLCTRIAPGC
eukprot:341201-Rhodomonas_salina.5